MTKRKQYMGCYFCFINIPIAKKIETNSLWLYYKMPFVEI